jgi:hypothetical protein
MNVLSAGVEVTCCQHWATALDPIVQAFWPRRRRPSPKGMGSPSAQQPVCTDIKLLDMKIKEI